MTNLVKIARTLIALLFVFSGISKIISLVFFDGLVAELILGPEFYDEPVKLIWIQIFTRILISIELLLGVAILQDWKVKKLILPSIQLMLLVFTIHLFYEGFTNGFGGNCGCFGDVLPMSNAESIIKNVVAMLLGIFIHKNYLGDHQLSHFPSWVPGLLLGGVTLATLLLGVKDYTPPEYVLTDKSDSTGQVEVQDTVISIKDTIIKDTAAKITNPDTGKSVVEIPKAKTLSTKDEKTISLLENFKTYSPGKYPNFREGTHLIAMFSMTCSHCQEVIGDFCEASRDGKLPGQFLFNFGMKREQDYFFDQAKGCNYPHVRTENYVAFKRILQGNDFPRILVIRDGEIVKDWNVSTYNKETFRKYFGIKKKVDPVDPLNPGKAKEKKDSVPKLPWE